MSNQTFPNGTILTSTSQTPQQIETVFQAVVAQIFGFPITNPPQPFGTQPFNQSPLSNAWSAVRVGWQQTGQPAWLITDDVCIVRASTDDDPYSRTREAYWTQNDSISLVQQMGYTQVWHVHFTLYGPNCSDRGRLIISGMALDWVHDLLAGSSLYAVTDWHRQTFTPELFQGEWWQRSDVDLQFNELVLESIIAPAAAGVDVTVESDTASVTVDIVA